MAKEKKQVEIEVYVPVTEEYQYIADDGHKIYKEPTFDQQGQGSVEILNMNENSFTLKITATKGSFSVELTSYEEWIHSKDSGDRDYPRP